jgi:hypothetical protein
MYDCHFAVCVDCEVAIREFRDDDGPIILCAGQNIVEFKVLSRYLHGSPMESERFRLSYRVCIEANAEEMFE